MFTCDVCMEKRKLENKNRKYQSRMFVFRTHTCKKESTDEENDIQTRTKCVFFTKEQAIM